MSTSVAVDKDLRSKDNWGGTELGSNANLSDILQEAPSIDGIKPPAGCAVMQKLKLRAQDGQYGGSTGRRNMSRFYKDQPQAEWQKALRQEGYASTTLGCIMLPTNFPNGGNMWVAPLEFHQSDPGGGTGVAEMHVIFNGSSMSFDVGGGPRQAGGLGNPGKIRTFSANYPINERLVWHLIYLYYKLGSSNGEFELMYAQVGRDSVLKSLSGLRQGPTCYASLLEYVLLGLYNSLSSTGETDIYLAGWGEKAQRTDADVWAHTLLGTPVPDPNPPPPPPPPPAQVTVEATIKENGHLAVGSRYTIMVDTTGPIEKMQFFLDGVMYDEDPNGKLRNGRFVTGLDLVLAAPGPHKFGFASIGVDGKEISKGTFKSYTIILDPNPVLNTNEYHRDQAIYHLEHTSETFKVWNARTPARKIGTHWQQAEDHIRKVANV